MVGRRGGLHRHPVGGSQRGSRALDRGACREREESVATPARRLEPAIDRAPVKAVAGDHPRSTAILQMSPGFHNPVSVRLASWRNGVSHNQHVLPNILTYE